jgi:hypothetical protein
MQAKLRLFLQNDTNTLIITIYLTPDTKTNKETQKGARLTAHAPSDIKKLMD